MFAAPSNLPIQNQEDISLVCIELGSQPAQLLALAAEYPKRYPLLLESSAGAAAQSRYDLLLAYPQEQLELTPDNPQAFDFFVELDKTVAENKVVSTLDLPFIGGWLLYLSYELGQCVEPILNLPAAKDNLPLALAVRCPAAFIYDRQTQNLYILSEDNNAQRVASMYEDWLACHEQTIADAPVAAQLQEAPPADYIQQVENGRDYIARGDIFQTNLSRIWRGQLQQDTAPARLYAALRKANPAPFSGLMQWRGQAVISSSPERLLQHSRQGQIQTRPIAGTRPRSTMTDRQVAEKQALLAHPKERAEHGMIVDLERNDMGRVCQPGSIKVSELMVAETYTHVHHIVSNIRGQLRPDIGHGGALKAVFPGGTITGCPKVRCMEIIAEQEGEGRGAYTGSFGYLSRCGQMDTNILIRSITQNGRQVSLRAGAGIVADSDPERELNETRAKARGVLKAFKSC